MKQSSKAAGTAHTSSKKCLHVKKKTTTHILTHTHTHNPFAVTPPSLSLLDIVVIVALPFFYYNKDSEVYQDELSLTHADPVVMLPWTFGDQRRGPGRGESGGEGC